MAKWLRRLGLALLLPAVAVVAAAVWTAYRFISYEQVDDEAHLAAKRRYLDDLADRHPLSPAAPDIIFILLDDLGYGDLGFTGSKAIRTPAIDQLAGGGVVLENFYSPAQVCSPARAGYLTGRLPPRAGLPDVVFPTSSATSLANILPGKPVRIPAEEITLADVLGATGYRTAMVGKWHLGDRSPSLPNDMGFDEFFGALYSNDMKPFALYRNRELAVPAPVDQTTLNARYTAAAVDFIRTQPDGVPLFLYYAHNFPHLPLFRDPAHAGGSDGGLYGDVVEDIDRSVGAIVQALAASGRLENTLLMVTSDNGPWYEGSPGRFRGRKGDTFDGGSHVPFVAHWPAGLGGGRRLPAMAMGTDLLPTILDWLGLPPPPDRVLDGKSIRPLLETDAAVHDYLYFAASESLFAVRDDRFKYHDQRPVFYAPMPSRWGFSIPQGPWLFDLSSDPDESYDVSMKYPDDTARLAQVLAAKHEDMARNQRGWR